MTRITKQMLEGQLSRLNKITGMPEKPWKEGEAQIGCYSLDWAYGGVKLVQMDSPEGGERNVLSIGYVKKAELHQMLVALIRGIEIGKGEEV